MHLWYTEKHTPQAEFSIKLGKQLYGGQSEFQRIDVLESEEFGRVLCLDGRLMLTERDEFIYHEMIVHVPMAVQPDTRNILVIGGGDGGVVRELVRYKTVERIDLVEIDPLVVKVCKEFLPATASGLDDARVAIHYEDGLKYVRRFENRYDLIIVDSTDPYGPGEGLFAKEFYGNCFNALTCSGTIVNQHENPFYAEDAKSMQRMHKRIDESFPICKVYQAHIPTYPSGHWLFGFASKRLHPVVDLDAESWNALCLRTRYYNTALHVGCFALPTYVEELLRNRTE